MKHTTLCPLIAQLNRALADEELRPEGHFDSVTYLHLTSALDHVKSARALILKRYTDSAVQRILQTGIVGLSADQIRDILENK